MKFLDLNTSQWSNIADLRPFWLAANFPHIMIDHRHKFMIKHHFNWTKEHYPHIIQNSSLPMTAENLPFPAEPYDIFDNIPGMILSIINNEKIESEDFIVQ